MKKLEGDLSSRQKPRLREYWLPSSIQSLLDIWKIEISENVLFFAMVVLGKYLIKVKYQSPASLCLE